MTDKKTDPNNVIKEINVAWKLYRRTEWNEIYIGVNGVTGEYYAASSGPPFFCFVSGTYGEIIQQISMAIDLYTQYKNKKDVTKNADA